MASRDVDHEEANRIATNYSRSLTGADAVILSAAYRDLRARVVEPTVSDSPPSPLQLAEDAIEDASKAYRKREDPDGEWCDVEEENEEFAFRAGYLAALAQAAKECRSKVCSCPNCHAPVMLHLMAEHIERLSPIPSRDGSERA